MQSHLGILRVSLQDVHRSTLIISLTLQIEEENTFLLEK